MPVTVVVGGQYGSEGKGKIAQFLARERGVSAVVRVGGPNSGHTPLAPVGRGAVLRQLPTAAFDGSALCVLPSGSYVDPLLLVEEIERTSVRPQQVLVDPFAVVVTPDHQREESGSGLQASIGSTLSGTGAALWHRVRREADVVFAKDVPLLQDLIADTKSVLRSILTRREWVLIEGTQGFGLSLLHGDLFPFATSRDTSAASAVAEAGLSPLDVEEIALVLRAFPIRVGGNSGPLEGEIDWEDVAARGQHDHPIQERTSVTGRIRRVARFSSHVVGRALAANRPTLLAMNHLDYVDHGVCLSGEPTDPVARFVDAVEREIGMQVALWGVGPTSLVERPIAAQAARVVSA
jgi:adenylosuccinate synthase